MTSMRDEKVADGPHAASPFIILQRLSIGGALSGFMRTVEVAQHCLVFLFPLTLPLVFLVAAG